MESRSIYRIYIGWATCAAKLAACCLFCCTIQSRLFFGGLISFKMSEKSFEEDSATPIFASRRPRALSPVLGFLFLLYCDLRPPLSLRVARLRKVTVPPWRTNEAMEFLRSYMGLRVGKTFLDCHCASKKRAVQTIYHRKFG